MRRRKEKTNPAATLATQKVGDGVDEVSVDEKGAFFACYLLTSLSPRHRGHTYIGFTVKPKRRIRQHNGEIGSGALRTKRKRPWEMVMCIYGFPTNVSALQFEWAWQHPKESLAVRKAAAELKCLSGVANKIKLAYTMLTLPSWQSLNLTVNFFSTKYIAHCASCPSLPDHMKVQVQSMDDLPCYDASHNCPDEDEYDFDSGDELNHPRNPAGIVPEEMDAASRISTHDHQNDKTEYGTSSDLGQEKWASSNMSNKHASIFNPDEYANERSLQVPANIIKDLSLDERQIMEIGASSRQLPTDEKYWPILDESSTWDSNLFAQQKTNSYDLHQRPLRSAALSRRHDSVIYVNDMGACSSNGKKSTPTSRVIGSSAEVEVIDLMTPSPDCRVGVLSKNKWDLSIIDLTRSPNFVQL